MKLIKPSYKILTHIDNEILIDIERVARTCYKSEDRIEIGNKASNGELYDREPKSAKILIEKLIKRGHEAMLEFGSNITVKFICDRGVSHELVRHRLCSFAQESTRYCNYGKDDHITFIIPSWFTDDDINTINNPKLEITNVSEHWKDAMQDSEIYYNKLISKGWLPQQARSVLPNSLKTEINIDANIREWRHIFKLRTNKAAHPQMRELMCPLLDEFKSKIPILFDDINYE